MVNFNVAQIELAFLNLSQLQITHWPIEQNVDALIGVNDKGSLSFEALYPGGVLRAIAKRLRIVGIQGYHREE